MCRERKRARAGGRSGMGGSGCTHEGRGGGGASQGAAHLELLSSKLAFPRRAARSTRVVVTRRARLRGGRAQGWHGERGCARRGVRGPRAHPPDLARRVPHMRSATGCSAPEGPAPLRLRRAVPRPGANAAPRGDWRPPHNLRFTTLDRQPPQPATLTHGFSDRCLGPLRPIRYSQPQPGSVDGPTQHRQFPYDDLRVWGGMWSP